MIGPSFQGEAQVIVKDYCERSTQSSREIVAVPLVKRRQIGSWKGTLVTPRAQQINPANEAHFGTVINKRIDVLVAFNQKVDRSTDAFLRGVRICVIFPPLRRA